MDHLAALIVGPALVLHRGVNVLAKVLGAGIVLPGSDAFASSLHGNHRLGIVRPAKPAQVALLAVAFVAISVVHHNIFGGAALLAAARSCRPAFRRVGAISLFPIGDCLDRLSPAIAAFRFCAASFHFFLIGTTSLLAPKRRPR